MLETRRLRDAWRRRWAPNLVFFFVVWPLLSAVAAAHAIAGQSITSDVRLQAHLAALPIGMLHMLPELAVVALLAAFFSSLLFALTDRTKAPDPPRTRWSEPAVFFLALTAGITLEYPSMLSHLMFLPLRGLNVMTAQLVVVLAVMLLAYATAFTPRRRADAARHVMLTLLLVGIGWAVVVIPSPPVEPAGRGGIFLIGLDSVAQEDSLPELRALTRRSGGTWYTKAVTPGLLTNSVWASLVMHRLVHETGVFLAFQRPDWGRSPFNLVQEARRAGFHTISHFSGQLTVYTGAVAPFDVNRSGPKGWLQIATACLKDGGVLAPAILPRLPRIPFAGTPMNQAGTYSYRLRDELSTMFGASASQPVFIAAHLDYLHQPAYPPMSLLTVEERGRVRRAAAGAVRDLSLDWQYPHLPHEPIGIYAWKLRYLDRTLARMMAESALTAPDKANRVVIFSDHGKRDSMGVREFGHPRFYNVPLVTFGIPASDPVAPRSLLDIPAMVGLPDRSRPGPNAPVVEYTNVDTPADWKLVLGTARMKWDGEVEFAQEVISRFARRLVAYEPFGEEPRYTARPAILASDAVAGEAQKAKSR